MNATENPCGLDGVCSPCWDAALTPAGADPVDESLAGRRRRHRAPDEWDTPLFDALVTELGVPGLDDEDPEEFCDLCLAGMESSQHLGGCTAAQSREMTGP